MRISPFAFFSHVSRDNIFDACRITHNNSEAYAGCLAVYLAVRAAITGQWEGRGDIFERIIPGLPDTAVRNRLMEIAGLPGNTTIEEIARLGTNGYVVHSVPFSIFCATQIRQYGTEEVLDRVIRAGGDTDTNASITGQITGSLIGAGAVPEILMRKLKQIQDFNWINDTIRKTKAGIG